MRNYWRYIAYIWRYKVRVLAAIACSVVWESLFFVSVVAFIGSIELLFRLRNTGSAGKLGENFLLRTGPGKALLDYLAQRAATDEKLIATVIAIGLGFLALASFQAVLEFLRRYLLHCAMLRGWTDMMKDLFDRMTRLSSRFFSQQSIGHTMATFGPDTSELASSGRAIFHFAISAPIRLLIALGLTLAINWRLSLLIYMAVPVALYVFKLVGDRLRRYTRKSLERRADTMRILGETIQGMTVIKAFCAEDYQRQRYNETAAKMLSYGLRGAMVRAFSRPGTGILYWTVRIAVVTYGVHLLLHGAISMTGLFSFVFALKQVYDPLEKLRDVNNDVQRSRAAADRVFALMDMVPEIRERPGARALAPVASEIRFDRVSFAYDPPHEIIHGFDLTIAAGETIAFVGENGSGKSTLVKLLLRFYDPTEGAVSIDGVDLRDATLTSLRGQIGYMPQEIVLFNDTIRNNLAFGNQGCSDEEIEAAARAALAHDFIVGELPDGYDTIVGEGGTKLSGGQRQRVALARAMLRDPRILILDEPTSSMDADVEHRLHDHLAAFAEGRTLILIAHRFAVLRRCDRIVALADGRIEHIGTHAELLDASPTYRNLHDKQSGNAHTA